MKSSTALNSFIENIMSTKDLKMGGASAGIIGSSNGNSIIELNLKKSVIAFATEYQKQNTNKKDLIVLADEVNRNIQTAHMVSLISDKKFDELLDQLEDLMIF